MRVLLLAALSLGIAGPASFVEAQLPGVEDGELGRVATRIARAWSAGDAGTLESLFAPGGVRFRDRSGGHGVLDARKAGAAVRELLDRHGPGRVSVRGASPAGGSPPRGFVELSWLTGGRGTSERISYTLFVGMVRHAGGWRIDEIRLLP